MYFSFIFKLFSRFREKLILLTLLVSLEVKGLRLLTNGTGKYQRRENRIY